MNRLLFWCCLALLGCGTGTPPLASQTTAADPAPSAAAATPLVDLGTRQTGEDWPAFLGPRGDSTSLETGIQKPWPAAGLPIVWRRQAGVGYGMPSISRGRAFQFGRFGQQNRLVALNSESGEELWRFEYPTDYEDMYGYNNGPRCAPTVDGDRVYIFGQEGMLHCLLAATGKQLWRINTQQDFGVVQNFFGVGSCPIVHGELLIVQVGGSPKGSDPSDFGNLKGNGSGIVAFDKRTGEVKYKLTDELASYATPIVVSHAGRKWGFVFARGGLVAFDPDRGQVDFQYPWRATILESVNAANPVVIGDKILLSECYGVGSVLLQFNPGPKVVWKDDDRRREKILRSHWCTPIHRNGYLYGCDGRHTNEASLRCIELATGAVTWEEPRTTRSSLLWVDGHFICLGEYGDLRLFKENAEKYELVSEYSFPAAGNDNWAAPILSHGLMYLRVGEEVLCLELIPKAKG